MSQARAAHKSESASRRLQRSPQGRFLVINTTVLVSHLMLALVAKPQLAAEAAGGVTLGSLLLLGQAGLLLWTAHRYTSSDASVNGGQA